METAFVTILQKLITEQGKEALFDPKRGKSLLADYVQGEYKKESRLLLSSLEAGVPRAIATTGELDLCKKQQVKLLQEDHFLSEEAAADVVDTLALVLRGQEKPKKRCKSCGKELQDEWKTCPYCSSSTEGREAPPASGSGASAAGSRKEASANKPLQAAEDSFNRGKTFFERADYDTAIAEFTEALRLDPNYADAYDWRGAAYSFKFDFDRAIADLTQVIRLDPNNAYAYARRGDAYCFKYDNDSAITDYTQAIRLDPNNASAYSGRGSAYGGKGNHDQAIVDLTQAIRLDPNNAPAYFGRGNAYYARGQFFFNAALIATYNGVNADADVNRWKADNNSAIADYTQAIRLDPNTAMLYFNRGNTYKSNGDRDSAIADYTQAIRLDPNFAPAYYERGNAYRGKNDNDRAIADFTQAIRLDPNFAPAYSGRGSLNHETGNYAQARADVNRALQINPNDPLAQPLSNVLQELGY